MYFIQISSILPNLIITTKKIIKGILIRRLSPTEASFKFFVTKCRFLQWHKSTSDLDRLLELLARTDCGVVLWSIGPFVTDVMFCAILSSGSGSSRPVLCGAGTGQNFWGFVLFWVTYFWLGLFPVVRKKGLSLEPIGFLKFLKLYTSLDSYKPCRACQKVCSLGQDLGPGSIRYRAYLQ